MATTSVISRRQSTQADNMEWRDQVPLLELQKMIGTACAYVNLSWFEVFSLIDLMALTSRTPSILSTGSYLYDQTRANGAISGVEFVNPNDIVTARKKLTSLPTQVAAHKEFLDKSWSEAAIRKKWAKILNSVEKRAPECRITRSLRSSFLEAPDFLAVILLTMPRAWVRERWHVVRTFQRVP